MKAVDHIKANLIAYLLPIVAMLMWAGFTAVMDSRHEPVGSVDKVQMDMSEVILKKELRTLKRERRKMETYQRLAPNSEYSTSREAEIATLTDEISEIEMELQ